MIKNKKKKQEKKKNQKRVFKFLKKNIHYNNVIVLKVFLSKHGKIFSHRVTRLTLQDQKKLAKSIKQARILGLIFLLID